MKKLIIGLCLASTMVVSSLVPAHAATGKETVHDLVTLFSAWNGDAANKGIFNEIAQRIDYGQMSELTLKPAQWDSFSPAQKAEVASSFRQLVESRYYKRWHKLFLRSKLTIANEVKAGSDDYVKSYITNGKGEDDTVVWRLRPRNGELKVVSLNVNGKDLLARISPRIQKQFEKRGAQGTIAWLHNKADLDEDEGDSERDVLNHRQTAASTR